MGVATLPDTPTENETHRREYAGVEGGRTYHPRENEHYREITDEYRMRAEELKAALAESRERYARYGREYKRRGADNRRTR